ncbi:hypothetical protein BCh11DRAFT_06462 [Burkholderia sp. Ch1-1]|nr:hypothetical protein BCh11DRAFT_06462 [Burkholderia sp. Ch1-1]
MLMTTEQDEFVFKTAVETAASLARNGEGEQEAVRAATAVVAAAIAAQRNIDALNVDAAPVAKVAGTGIVEIFDETLPVGTLLRRA